jgi:hypothetical protein
MRIGEYENETTLLNASTNGVLAAIANPPVRGTRLTLIIGSTALTGQVRWRGADCCGIALRDSINVGDLLDGHVPAAALGSRPHGVGGLSGILRAFVGERISMSRFNNSGLAQ